MGGKERKGKEGRASQTIPPRKQSILRLFPDGGLRVGKSLSLCSSAFHSAFLHFHPHLFSVCPSPSFTSPLSYSHMSFIFYLPPFPSLASFPSFSFFHPSLNFPCTPCIHHFNSLRLVIFILLTSISSFLSFIVLTFSVFFTSDSLLLFPQSLRLHHSSFRLRSLGLVQW